MASVDLNPEPIFFVVYLLFICCVFVVYLLFICCVFVVVDDGAGSGGESADLDGFGTEGAAVGGDDAAGSLSCRACHTSHITHHTSHITHHTSHITHHTSLPGPAAPPQSRRTRRQPQLPARSPLQVLQRTRVS